MFVAAIAIFPLSFSKSLVRIMEKKSEAFPLILPEEIPPFLDDGALCLILQAFHEV